MIKSLKRFYAFQLLDLCTALANLFYWLEGRAQRVAEHGWSVTFSTMPPVDAAKAYFGRRGIRVLTDEEFLAQAPPPAPTTTNKDAFN